MLVLDCEGLAKAVLRDREVTGWLAVARAEDDRAVTSAATLVEAIHPRINRPAFEWVLSILTSDPDDLAALCGEAVTVVKV